MAVLCVAQTRLKALSFCTVTSSKHPDDHWNLFCPQREAESVVPFGRDTLSPPLWDGKGFLADQQERQCSVPEKRSTRCGQGTGLQNFLAIAGGGINSSNYSGKQLDMIS